MTTIIDAVVCMAILLIAVVVIAIPLTIAWIVVKAIADWIKWTITRLKKFDDDWYDL